MKGYRTTFLGLFDEPAGDRPPIREIEIPVIQRDFAQGRDDEETTALRDRFLDKIVQAATTDSNLGLDFVYGDIQHGVLQPLDGQQRLTTLFLLHWYVASRAGTLDPAARWLCFSYATRPTARDFTRTLAENAYPGGPASPLDWITDQPWYVFPWRQDPTISSMLVMLDAIHDRLDHDSIDFTDVWDRLAARPDEERDSAIWFLFLPVVDLDHGEDLYIKMNSRGKPLTTFEVFKADFESIIKAVDPDRHRHLVDSMDGSWADTLWEYEKRSDGDFKTDDEFERYLTFIIEISEWRDGAPDRKWHDKSANRLWPIEERARLAFADAGNEHAARNRDFFFHAFDTWVDTDPGTELGALFRAGGTGRGPIPLFSATPDLFGACISGYGTDFSVQETLLLFGVLLSRQAGDSVTSDEVAQRLRSLRNLTAAFLDRDRYMSSYVASTEKLVLGGSLDDLEGFRGDWVSDEALKWAFLEDHPGLKDAVHRLEDDPLVRGRIMVFDLDAAAIRARANAFAEVSRGELRDIFGAALLTKGDYSRDVGWEGQRRQLGSSQKDDSWTDLLTTGSRSSLENVGRPLASLLDDVAERLTTASAPSVREALDAIRLQWLADRESRSFYDWRYYLVRYAGARSSKGDGYYNGTYDRARGGFGYRHLRILHGSSYIAYFSDALLRASWVEGRLTDVAEEPSWYRGYERGLTLKKSRLEIRCEEDGYQLVPDDGDGEAVEQARKALTQEGAFDLDLDQHLRVRIRQKPIDGRQVDAEDRIQLCVQVVSALATAGL
ncbi:DUF262 domain-containing protein [Nocardioides sambongensis]|uniref:DUF262 domain-containing protein n=1 Tax=Nocardioides sambongensis TaxID=2589074 RepID=UPI001129EA89|nr:DUF262 domain-containing protein [Nocardioides sambongensis]